MTLKPVSICLVLTLVVAPIARADSGDEATITVVDEGATPEDVVKVIELPDRARAGNSKTAPDATGNGQNKAAESGREVGQQVADDARDKDLQKDLKEQAREDAKHQGKGKGHDDDHGNPHGSPH